MTRTTDQQTTFDRFSKRYEHTQSNLVRAIERRVCGCDYGATSWTTRDETQVIAKALGLAPGTRLLDVGSGSGWPAAYLANQTGCDLTMTDLHHVGLRMALDRAAADKVAGTCFAAVADGAALPFRSGCFDAIFHSDVLCCLPEKMAILTACRRVVGANGKMVFAVISIAPGLTRDLHQQAVDGGPPFVSADMPYPEMLGRTGWDITDRLDLTDQYRDSMSRMVDQLKSNANELSALFGEDDASAELAKRRAALDALERGLLQRELFSVVPKSGAA